MEKINNTEIRRQNNMVALKDKVINLVAVREVLERTMGQDELAILARGEARRLGLRRATKVSASQVSRFMHDKLPRSQVFAAILSAVEKHLDVDELFISDVDQHA